jgi:threonine dehydrogenase-like Zn-dependent dehydrogenase
VVFIGLHDAESELPVNEMVRGETQVTGCFCYRTRTFERALGLLADGLLGPGPWLEERPLEAGPAAFEELLGGQVAASKVVLRP